MKRRSRAGGEPTKGRRRKTPEPSSRDVTKATTRPNSSVSGADTDVTRVIRELKEAREQQAATSEVLNVISRSTFDLPTVLSTLVETAARLCKADKVQILLPSENANRFYSAGSFGYSSEYNDYLKTITFAPGREGVVGRVLLERKPVQIDDVLADPEYRLREVQRLGGFRTHLGLPLLREDRTIGVLLLSRVVVQPFENKHIELLSTFAAQAVIAIENTRLLNELRETLQQQTATADVLKVISRATFDLPKVLNTLLESAARLCEADKGAIFRPTNDSSYYVAASYRHTAEYDEHQKHMTFAPGRSGVVGRVLLKGNSVQIPDVLADPEYTFREIARVGDFRTIVGVPLLREGVPIGVFALQRAAVRPFTETQIRLVETFADQAVIAIENVRLFEAEQQRTHELTESLEQQTASSEVLQVISSSPGDLQPVFETMLQNAVRICDAKFGNIFRWDGDALHLVATHNIPPAFAELRRRSPFRPGPENHIGRMVATKAVVHVADLAADQRYIERRDPAAVAAVELGGIRTFVAVPMLKENELIGALIVYRQEVRPFTDKQIELVTNFAAQAVIAIENARLLNELRQRTDELGRSVEELRALGEVSQAVNSTLDLETVLSTIVAKAVQLSGTEAGAIYVFDDLQREFRLRATYGMDQELIEALTHQRIGLDEPNVVQALAQGEPVQVADLREGAPWLRARLFSAPASVRCWWRRYCAGKMSLASW